MCGIAAVWNVRKAAELTVIGLHNNQHRAMDFAGIVSSDGSRLYRESGTGLARQVFTGRMLDRLHGRDALGHIRYPTVSDDASRDNIQPVVGSHRGTPIAVAHNGNLTNVEALRARLRVPGLATSMDSELILRLIEEGPTGDLEADVSQALAQLQGAFSLGILTPDRLLAARDPHGNRPLSIGRLEEGYALTSETCAFNNLDAEDLGEIEAGTLLSISREGVRTVRFAPATLQQCRFEAIYFSHPASTVFGEGVMDFRMAIGRALATRCPAPGADLVVPVPDSSIFMAMGYAEEGHSGRYAPIIIRSHYVGRSFIAATQAKRDVEVAQKFNFVRAKVEGRSIVLVDDSIMRLTTLPKIVAKLQRYGARAIHVRIGSPPNLFPCTYGINTPTREELVANALDPEQIRQRLGVDSLAYLPLEVLRTLSPNGSSFCYACMDGKYW